MKLPLQRMPYSGSTDSWIADADGKDIARISGRHGESCCVAFPDKVAEQIVQAINTGLTEGELQAAAVLAVLYAKSEREDVIGAILKTGAHHCLGDKDDLQALVAFKNKLEAAYEKAKQTPIGHEWPDLRPPKDKA